MRNRILAIATLALVLASAAVAQEGNIAATSSALITFRNPEAWDAGIRLQRDRREFQAGDKLIPLDIDHIVARIGATPLPFLNIWAEGGTCRAEATAEEGESGLQWGVGGYARLLELPIEESPVVGVKQAISLGIDLSYKEFESNFSDADFSWEEFQATPLVSYTQNRKGDNRWFFYEPTGIAIRGGPTFISTDGEYGQDSIKENRDFGGRVIFDLLWSNGWTTTLDGTFLGSEEREIALAITKNF